MRHPNSVNGLKIGVSEALATPISVSQNLYTINYQSIADCKKNDCRSQEELCKTQWFRKQVKKINKLMKVFEVKAHEVNFAFV